MRKTVYGFCPVQNKEYSIKIDYIDNSTLSQKCFEKGTCRCNYHSTGKCDLQECPIYESAPNELK